MGKLIAHRMMRHSQFPCDLLVTHARGKSPCHDKFSRRQDFHRIHWPDSAQMAALLSDQRDFDLRTAIDFSGQQKIHHLGRYDLGLQFGPLALQQAKETRIGNLYPQQ